MLLGTGTGSVGALLVTFDQESRFFFREWSLVYWNPGDFRQGREPHQEMDLLCGALDAEDDDRLLQSNSALMDLILSAAMQYAGRHHPGDA